MKIKPFLKSDTGIALLISLVPLLIHFYTNAFAGYGIFRDEYYYIACSNHLSAGYVDHPPFSIYMLAVSRFLFGETQFGLRVLPSVIGAFIVFLTGMLTKELGGNKWAIFLACSCTALAPVILGMHVIFSMNVFDHLFWLLAVYLTVLLVKNEKPAYWIYLGIVLGLGLLNKVGVLWLGAGIFAGILFTPLRSSLKTKYPYIAGAIALLLFSPYIIWNITHDFAHLEFIKNATQLKYASLTRTGFIIEQFMILHPFTALVWLPGLYYFLFDKEGKKFRILGIIYAAAFLILFINGKSKGEYLVPAYFMLFAGGAVFYSKIIDVKRSGIRETVRYALPSMVIIACITTIPLGVPILPPETFVKYAKAMGQEPKSSEGKELSEMPPFYADMFGWENMAQNVSKVYQSLPESEKKTTIIFALNYGEAGALQYYSKKYPLPQVISPHNSYWYWGAAEIKPKTVRTAIVLGGNPDDHKKSCGEVIHAVTVKNRYAMPYENVKIYICRKIKLPFDDIWRRSRFFI